MGIIKKINKNSGYTPCGKLSWTTKLTSEFLGTIFLSWMIGLLGVTFAGGSSFASIISGGADRGDSSLAIGFWVALDILICVAVFARWSCDLNPLVTIFRMLSKQNSVNYGLTKIAVQLFAGLVAGLCIWSTQAISGAISGLPADQVITNFHQARAAWAETHHNLMVQASTQLRVSINDLINNGTLWNGLKSLPNFNIPREFRAVQNWSAFTTGLNIHNIDDRFWDVFIAFTGEFLGAFILLWPIFSKELKSPLVRDLLLIMIVGFGVACLLELGTVSWNPSRLLATNWIYDLLKPGTHAMGILPAYLAGELAAPFVLFYGQKLIKKSNHIWEKWLKIGVVNDITQHANELEIDKIHDAHKHKSNNNKKAK